MDDYFNEYVGHLFVKTHTVVNMICILFYVEYLCDIRMNIFQIFQINVLLQRSPIITTGRVRILSKEKPPFF